MRFLQWSLGVVLVLALVLVAGYAVSRAMGPAEGERQALALIDAPPAAASGRDGFAALYTSRHDVPVDRQAGVVAEDVRRFAASRPPDADGAGGQWDSVLDDWPLLEAAGGQGGAWCRRGGDSCLDQVRAAPEAYAQLLARNAGLLDRAEALRGYDHFRNPFPPRLDMPLPAFQNLVRLGTRTAWRFHAGQVDAALADACADTALGARMIESGDTLIGSMIGAALVRENTALLAQMLAGLPREHPLPAQCAATFARPLALDQGLCRTMGNEGRLVISGMREHADVSFAASAVEADLPEWAARLLFDPERTAARMAPAFAWYCGDQARDLLARDLPLDGPAPPHSRLSLRCASNAIGCILADIARPAYGDYGRRLQDAGAQLRGMTVLLQLRAQDGPIDPVALERLPAPLSGGARPLLLDPEAATLGVALYGHLAEADAARTWSLPLPASRLQAVAPSP